MNELLFEGNMKTILIISGVVLAVAAFTEPFASDIYGRITISRKLNHVLTEQDQKAFQVWNGDAHSFAKALYARCKLANGQESSSCAAYQSAAE